MTTTKPEAEASVFLRELVVVSARAPGLYNIRMHSLPITSSEQNSVSCWCNSFSDSSNSSDSGSIERTTCDRPRTSDKVQARFTQAFFDDDDPHRKLAPARVQYLGELVLGRGRRRLPTIISEAAMHTVRKFGTHLVMASGLSCWSCNL